MLFRKLQSLVTVLCCAGLLAACGIAAKLEAQPQQRPQVQKPAAWVQRAVLYELNTARFSQAGNFQGVIPQLKRLHNLGVSVIWIMPINPVGQIKSIYSPYCIQDYYGINPRYGTARDFARLVQAAHKQKLKVILDVALNHTSWDNPLIQKHPEWYEHSDADTHNPKTIISPPGTTWNDVAQLDYTNPDLQQFMIQMLRYWMKTYHLDGFRCDAADRVPMSFWRRARASLTEVKPDLFLLGEYQKPDMTEQAFDANYSYPLYGVLESVLRYGRPASDISTELEREQTAFAPGLLHLHFSDNHDQERATLKYGQAAARAASILMFTLNGIPSLYTGMEVGDATPGDFMHITKPVDWRQDDHHMTQFYRQLIALRNAHPALQQGAQTFLANSAPDHVVTYLRHDSGEEFLVAINLSAKPVSVQIPALPPHHWTDVTPEEGHASSSPLPSEVSSLALTAYGCHILRRPLP